MQRRLFMGMLAAVFSASLAAPAPRLRLADAPEFRGVSVEGDPEVVIKLVHLYQDNLWPEWRGDAGVRRMYEKFDEGVRRSGYAVMYTGDRLSSAAFEKAIKAANVVRTLA